MSGSCPPIRAAARAWYSSAIRRSSLATAGVLAALQAIDYEGWLVVEQDIFPQTSDRFAQAIDDQKKNRVFLADHQF